MKGATSNNSCIWCLVHKKDRCNMSEEYSHYSCERMKRKFGPNWHKQPGCQHQPLLNITPDNIVIDELHLVLRITDRLEQGLILEVIDWDEVCDDTANFKSIIMHYPTAVSHNRHKPSLAQRYRTRIYSLISQSLQFRACIKVVDKLTVLGTFKARAFFLCCAIATCKYTLSL